jgi:hypothetical protein
MLEILDIKALVLFVFTFGLLTLAVAQSAARPASFVDWPSAPAGFTLERLFLNADDEAWMSERAQLTQVGPCGAYDRFVLRYVGDPAHVPAHLGQPLHDLRSSLGEDTSVFDADEQGFLWASASTHTVADVDFYVGMVTPRDLMVRYEITVCHVTP